MSSMKYANSIIYDDDKRTHTKPQERKGAYNKAPHHTFKKNNSQVTKHNELINFNYLFVLCRLDDEKP